LSIVFYDIFFFFFFSLVLSFLFFLLLLPKKGSFKVKIALNLVFMGVQSAFYLLCGAQNDPLKMAPKLDFSGV
jgi:multisubunit Na+/H+ antiporter MnhC subunit